MIRGSVSYEIVYPTVLPEKKTVRVRKIDGTPWTEEELEEMRRIVAEGWEE